MTPRKRPVKMGDLAYVAFDDGPSYRAGPLDDHYGATEPLPVARCQCEKPIAQNDDREWRCFTCGKPL